MRNPIQMKAHRVLSALALVVLLAAGTDVLAQTPPGRPGASPAATGPAKAGKEADLLPNDPVITQHAGKFNGQNVSYTTEAAWIPIRDEGKVVAKMFYVAYTKNGVTE